ncbi:MAG: hypothetical protein C0483_19515 [Pirellula sp.]|nr:hypothetical protein [Pirellula sp.]
MVSPRVVAPATPPPAPPIAPAAPTPPKPGAIPLAPVPPKELPLGVKLEPIERPPNAPLDADCACAEAAQTSASAKPSNGPCIEMGIRLIGRSLKPCRRSKGNVVEYSVYYNHRNRQKLPA